MSVSETRETDSLESLFWAEIIQVASSERVCPYRGNAFVSPEQHVLFCECPKTFERLTEASEIESLTCSSHMCPVRTFLAGTIH